MSTTIDRSPRLLLAAPDAASTLSISEKHLWNMTKTGAIKSVRLGRSVRYSVAALEQWIQEQQGANGTNTE